jgi:HK97 family phage major capsid protein
MEEEEKDITQVELKNALTEVRETFKEMKSLKEKGKSIAALEEKWEKANKDLDAHEEKNQKLVMEKQAEIKRVTEAEEKIKELEVKMAKASLVGEGNQGNSKVKKEIKNLENFVRGIKNRDGSLDVEKKYLRTDSNEEGGFLVRDAYDDMIIKPITEISPIRNLARTKRINAKALNMASRQTLTKTYSTHQEGDTTRTSSNSTYSSPKIPVHSVTTFTEITQLALQDDSWMSIDSELSSDMVESRAQFEGALFVDGTGGNEAQGFMTYGLSSTNSGSAADFDYQDLIRITGLLKTGYKPVYGFTRKTLAYIRALEDGGGRPIWVPGNTAAGIDSQLNGYSYVEIPDMPEVGAGTYPVIFADFMKLYTIVDAYGAVFLRNPYKQHGMVEFTMESWLGGQVVLPEAGHLLKCAV